MEVTWRSEAIVFSFDENCPQNKPISASAHAFLVFSGYLWFSMGNIKVATWNGLKILIPKHMWKSKIGLLEQIWGQNPYDAFFLGHPVLCPVQSHRILLLGILFIEILYLVLALSVQHSNLGYRDIMHDFLNCANLLWNLNNCAVRENLLYMWQKTIH